MGADKGKDRKTLTDADIVSQRTPPRRTGQDRAADTDAGHARTDHDGATRAPAGPAQAAKDHGKVKDRDSKTDRDSRS
jgi:hypothetical protein